MRTRRLCFTSVTCQQGVGEPSVQDKYEIWNKVNRLGVGKELVSQRSGPKPKRTAAGERSVVDVAEGLKIEVGCDVYCREREHGHGVGH